MWRTSFRYFKRSTLKTLLIQSISIIIPQQYLNAFAASAKENEQLSTHRILAQLIPDQTTKAINAFAHVGDTTVEIAPVETRYR